VNNAFGKNLIFWLAIALLLIFLFNVFQGGLIGVWILFMRQMQGKRRRRDGLRQIAREFAHRKTRPRDV
jgi:uncharacterized integral membrane protein